MALKALKEKLSEMNVYLNNVVSKKYRYNATIINNLQVNILNQFKYLLGYIQFVT